MKLLLIYAHPEARSLNGSLRDFAIAHLKTAGHEVKVSDLYEMRWKAPIDQDDAPGYDHEKPFNPAVESQRVFAAGIQPTDIEEEQAKLLWADAVIFQFPLWWFSMPAILKGWVERVYAYGFAYGVGEHSESHWGDRYGEGSMAGKRAMLVVSMGGWESHYSGRGVNGALDDLLFPIQHGVLFYPGFTVMPPFPIYKTGKMDAARFEQLCTDYAARLDNLFDDEPLAFRRQNAGDYEIPALTLKPHIAPGRHDLGIHTYEGSTPEG
ncbi:Dehydrogenase [Pseudomonas syringae pv. primulae]|uniref:Dehydrogenase n=1 Tax=Pseudomonas syringae pv. primulae TaxID=251707 RepID=A0A0P9YNL9_9PSED|nr:MULTISPECIES: NAD(P)H-dependent oxidoreductase [Pseudomonas syringae group]KPY40074.1 Dehydrogenase [Pseudomonas syringae pv. primulae]MBD8186139.1 NAD(P)H-dependent oxidoreductase [Pseudomonas viridiflava]